MGRCALLTPKSSLGAPAGRDLGWCLSGRRDLSFVRTFHIPGWDLFRRSQMFMESLPRPRFFRTSNQAY